MTMNGIDISSWQAGIDIAQVPSDFVIIKATGGTGYVNPDCDRAFQQAVSCGKKVGVYHYAHELGYQGTPEQEAAFFLKNIQGYIGKAMLLLDWESDNKGDVSWAKAWLDTVYQKTGIRPLFYTYTAALNAYDFSAIGKANYGLWLADYGENEPSGYRDVTPPAGRGFPSVAMYQYTSNGVLPNYDQHLDLNIFYGDKPAWDHYATGGQPTPPSPTPKRRFGYRVDDLQVYNGVWQIRNNYLCPVDFEWKDNGILPEDVDRIDPATGATLPDQTLHTGDYFAFIPDHVRSADTPTMIKGYQFMRVNLASSGFVWLSIYNKEHLIYGSN